MAGFKQILMNLLNPRKKMLWILLVIILLSFGGYYMFQKSKHHLIEDDKTDIPNATSGSKQMVIHFFYADWCPHCTKAKGPWNTFNSNYHNRTVKNYKIICKPHDCTDSRTESKEMKKFNVEGFPTIKVEKDGNVIDFDAKITKSSLEQFVEMTV
jgi:thiol-disulfide isomerase/thioredoxin